MGQGCTGPSFDTYVLTFRPLAGHPAPPEVRVRQLLKFALRALRLRCVRQQPGKEPKEKKDA